MFRCKQRISKAAVVAPRLHRATGADDRHLDQGCGRREDWGSRRQRALIGFWPRPTCWGALSLRV